MKAESALGKTHPLDILVIEDNHANNFLLIGLLRKLGYEPDTIPNGFELPAYPQEKRYDVILVNCHILELDGFETTRRLRQHFSSERFHENLRIIVATTRTSNLNKSACLAAGIDEILTKPVDLSLFATALKNISTANRPPPLGSAVESRHSQFDFQIFLSRFQGFEEVGLEMGHSFLTKAPEMLAEIKSAIESEDAPKLEFAAHTLKGSLSYFLHEPTLHAANSLEQMGATGNLENASEIYRQLEREQKSLLAILSECLKTMGKIA